MLTATRVGSLLSGVFAGLIIVTSSVAVAAAPTESAQYTVTFQSTWSAVTHPLQFPPNPHFSGLVGGTHNQVVSFFDVGQLASPGIQLMAETGSKSTLISEVNTQITAGGAGSLISGGGISLSPGSVATSLTATQSHSRVTLVSMIAPSPDWFIGVSGLELLSGGDWQETVTVDLYPYDAGTDSGPSYTSSNQPTVPHVPIFAITGAPFSPGVPLGTFTFQRTDTPSPWSDLGGALAGTYGPPVLTGSGTMVPGQNVTLSLSNALENTTAVFVVGVVRIDQPLKGGLLIPSLDVVVFGLPTSGTGTLVLSNPLPASLAPGLDLFIQEWIADAAGPFGFAASNALCATVQ